MNTPSSEITGSGCWTKSMKNAAVPWILVWTGLKIDAAWIWDPESRRQCIKHSVTRSLLILISALSPPGFLPRNPKPRCAATLHLRPPLVPLLQRWGSPLGRGKSEKEGPHHCGQLMILTMTLLGERILPLFREQPTPPWLQTPILCE